MRRAVIERLMCGLGVDLDALALAHGYPRDHFAPELERCRRFVEEGLASIDGAKLTVPGEARAALRVIAAQFDQHLAPEGDGGRRHAPPFSPQGPCLSAPWPVSPRKHLVFRRRCG